MKRTVQVVGVLLVAAYPLLVFFGIRTFPLSYLVGLLILLALLRLAFLRGGPTGSGPQLVLAGVLLLLALYVLLAGDPRGFRYYPVAVNAVLLAVFGASLLRGPPLVERMARLVEPNLPTDGVAYTRGVTKVWCGFFLCNGLFALYTATCASLELWALYNGFLSYVLMGALFAGEWLVRRSRRRSSDAPPQ